MSGHFEGEEWFGGEGEGRAFVLFVVAGGLSFVVFTIAADLISASLDTADSLRVMAQRSQPQAMAAAGMGYAAAPPIG